MGKYSKLAMVLVTVAVLALSAAPTFAQAPVLTGTSTDLLDDVLDFISSSGIGIIIAAMAVIGLMRFVMRAFKCAVR